MIKLLFCIAALNYTLLVSMCFVTWDVCMRTAFHYFCCKWPGNEAGNDTLPPQYDKSAYSSIAAIQFYRLNWSHTPFIEHIHTHKHSHAACAYVAVHEHIHSHVFEFVSTITLSNPPKLVYGLMNQEWSVKGSFVACQVHANSPHPSSMFWFYFMHECAKKRMYRG